MSLGNTQRGLSPVVGVALLVAIVVLLALFATTSLTSLSESTLDSSAVHGAGSYDFDVSGETDAALRITSGSVQTRNSNYHVRINGKDVYDSWDGKSELEITCLFPGDRVTIYTSKGSTTNLVTQYTLEKVLECDLGFIDRFENAKISGNKVKVKTNYDFGLAIDPDGSGSDDTLGHDVYKQDIGTVPFSNEWHYSKEYNRELNGLGPPVWVFVLVDNVHWRDTGTYDENYNWTDPVPAGENPGEGTYKIHDHNDSFTARPDEGSGEPTNDIYVAFEPGCTQSRMKIVDLDAGYNNTVYMDDTVILNNVTNDHKSPIKGTEFTAPGIPC